MNNYQKFYGLIESQFEQRLAARFTTWFLVQKSCYHLRCNYSLRVAMQFTNPDKDNQIRLAELDALDERRLIAQ